MPPCVRRAYLHWSRRFFYAELFFARIYLSWAKSPTWNFVAIVGTIGVLLTILLFLVPLDDEASHAKLVGRSHGTQRSAWDLDSRLLAIGAPKSPAYPVEFLFDERATVIVKADQPPRRHTPAPVTDPPITPQFVPEPKTPVVVKEPDFDWGLEKQPQPPRLSLDMEIITADRRPRRELVIADTTWTGRSLPAEPSHRRPHDAEGADDLWQPFDEAGFARRGRRRSQDTSEHQTVAAKLDDRSLGEPWQPARTPVSAPSVVDVQLELSWDRSVSFGRRSPRLQLLNVGSEMVDRLDIFSGSLPEMDEASLSHRQAQSVLQLLPGKGDDVALPISAAPGRSSRQIFSVFVTTFVGSVTRLTAATPVAPPREPPPSRQPVPVREADRPHLTMTVDKPGKLPLDKMFSTPIQVVNDGNVTLYEVVIVAEVPPSLDHKFGRTVHYRLGKMTPGERKRATLLLTPLEHGAADVPLRVADKLQSASDTGAVSIIVTEDDLVASAPPTADRIPHRRSPDPDAADRRKLERPRAGDRSFDASDPNRTFPETTSPGEWKRNDRSRDVPVQEDTRPTVPRRERRRMPDPLDAAQPDQNVPPPDSLNPFEGSNPSAQLGEPASAPRRSRHDKRDSLHTSDPDSHRRPTTELDQARPSQDEDLDDPFELADPDADPLRPITPRKPRTEPADALDSAAPEKARQDVSDLLEDADPADEPELDDPFGAPPPK